MSAGSKPAATLPMALREADVMLRRLADTARLLPALTASNAVQERARLIEAIHSGGAPAPRWQLQRRRVSADLWRLLERARQTVRGQPGETLYLDRLDELELELMMIDCLGQAKRVRPLAARRFGTGRTKVALNGSDATLAQVARSLLESLPHREEPREIPARAAPGQPSLANLMYAMASSVGLDIEVKVEPRLSAGAATGDRTVFLADRKFGRRECLRFAVHEVLGHAIAAANARDQPIRLYEVGSAGSFGAQEGLALTLEERAGVLDGYRLRIISARVLATDRMHEGATFGETARWLCREHGFSAADGVTIAERAYRGGGVARDAGYLHGWLTVRREIASGKASLHAFRAGRVGVDVARQLPELVAAGLARHPRLRPNLATSLAATESGTRAETSPPSVAASFTMLEET